MDIQRVRSSDIVTLDGQDGYSFHITGVICVPVSWLYFQMRQSNIAEMSIQDLQSSLGGRVCLDVMLNAKKDVQHESILRDVDILFMNPKKHIDKYVNFGDSKVTFFVDEKEVNVLNFEHKPSDDCYKIGDPNHLFTGMIGSYADELEFNEHMLMMVKPYGIKLKNPTMFNNSSEFFS